MPMTYRTAESPEAGIKSCRYAYWGVVLTLWGTMALTSIAGPLAVHADQEQDPLVTYTRGYVTAKLAEGGRAIQIDGVTYGMQPDIVITDQAERPVTVLDIASGVKVFFHLDSAGKIDRLLIWIPS